MIKEHKTSVEPTAEPVTLAELKEQLRIESSTTEDDAFLNSLIVSARQGIEAMLGKVLMSQTVVAKLDEFPEDKFIDLPTPPVQSISSITYYDEDNASQTLSSSNYTLNDYIDPQRVELGSDYDWPATYDRWDAITITYVAGFASADAVPSSIKAALKMVAAELYESRGFTGDEKANALSKSADILIGINKSVHL